MTTAELRQSPVFRQLEAYEEGLKKDHTDAQVCGTAEETVAVGISTALLLERVNRGWRERVFRGVEPYREDTNRVHQSLFEVWLRVTESLLEWLGHREGGCGSVQGVEELCATARRLRTHLDSWQHPQLSMAIGLREMTFSPEAEAEIDAILQRPAPPLPASGVRLADPAQFPRK